MQACSLVHDGKINLSQSRIQVLYNAFGGYPNDIFIKQCRQCTNAPCVTACPFKAITIDSKTGVRSVNATLCTGCQTCLSINACPYLPFRIAGGGGTNKVVMCDLCSNATYWNKVGGPSGTQACVEICTMQALKFSSTVPTDYETNLKSANYLALTAITANVKTA
jgi:protein NrfC